MAYAFTGLVLWFAFFLLVPKGEWRNYYSTVIFTALLATVCDLLGVVYRQWVYIGPTVGGVSLWSDLGIAPPQGGLAVYFQRKFPARAWANWLFWISANALGERLFVQWGLISHLNWNSLKATIFIFFFSGLSLFKTVSSPLFLDSGKGSARPARRGRTKAPAFQKAAPGPGSGRNLRPRIPKEIFTPGFCSKAGRSRR